MRAAAALVMLVAGASPAAGAEPDALIAEINAVCVASRDAMLQGGTATVRRAEGREPLQVQRFDAARGRLSDTGWPAVTVRGRGTYDRSGFVLDARLRKAQIEQAQRYLGRSTRPWVLTRGQYGVIADRTFERFLRSDLLAPDRFIDLDSTTVPSQPQRCASHVLTDPAAVAARWSDGATTTYTLDYRLRAEDIRVSTRLVAADGVFVSGSLRMRGSTKLDNVIAWVYAPQRVAIPGRSVGVRSWIRATDAAALPMDLRMLASSIPGRTADAVQRAARKALPMANRGHVVKFRVRDVPGGVVIHGRNPYTGDVVAFEVWPGQPARRVTA